MSQGTKQVREKLAAAAQAESPVKIVRENLDFDMVDGFVVGLTEGWVVLQEITDGVYFDGFGFYRLDHVAEVGAISGTAGVEYLRRAMNELGRPPVPFEIPSDATVRDLMAIGSETSALLWVRMEDREDEPFVVGKLRGLHETEFDFQYIEANGVWEDGVDSWEYKDVTSVELGTRYLDALARFGDPLPPPPG